MMSIRDRLATTQPKKQLSKKTRQLLLDMSLAAYQLDASKPASFYYELFLSRLRLSYKTSTNKDKFLEYLE